MSILKGGCTNSVSCGNPGTDNFNCITKGIVTFILLDMMMVLNVLAKLIGDGAGVMDYNPYVIHAIYRRCVIVC